MQVDMSFLITATAVAIAVITGLSTIKRDSKSDTQKETTQLTTVIIKLENIGIGITRIENEVWGLKKDFQSDHDKLIRVEESAKQAHKRLDSHDRARKKDTEEAEYGTDN